MILGTKNTSILIETHDMYIVPAFKEDTMVKPGRGKGGLATVWKKGLTKYVSKIKCDIFRIQATKFNFPNAELLVLKELSFCHKL